MGGKEAGSVCTQVSGGWPAARHCASSTQKPVGTFLKTCFTRSETRRLSPVSQLTVLHVQKTKLFPSSCIVIGRTTLILCNCKTTS